MAPSSPQKPAKARLCMDLEQHGRPGRLRNRPATGHRHDAQRPAVARRGGVVESKAIPINEIFERPIFRAASSPPWHA